VHVSEAFGANNVAGQVTGETRLSVTVTGLVSVMLPVLVTTYLYCTEPLSMKLTEGAVLTIDRVDRWVAGTVTWSVGDVVDPLVAEAVLVTEPALRSAWLAAYEAVQVSVAFGARPPGGKAGQVTVVLLSDTVIACVSVTFPVLRTTYW
jgi:hypothetical protein